MPRCGMCQGGIGDALRLPEQIITKRVITQN